MASAEAASASLGPRYAPDDPTLPQPWKGLIDGSSGVLYYWNPDTNVTQYEKPTAAPPLPSGPPPAVSAPKLAAIPGARAAQSSDVQSQQSPQPSHSQQQVGQQMNPLSQPQQGQQMNLHPQLQQGQEMNPLLQQQTQLMPQGAQPHGMQVTPSGQLQGQFRPHMMPQPGHQTSSYFGQPSSQPGQQAPQPASQQMQGQGSQAQIYPGGQPPNYQYPNHQNPYMPYQQHMPPQVQQTSQHPGQHGMQGQHYPPQQENKAPFPQREESDNQPGKQTAFPSPQFQQAGSSSIQNFPGGINPVHAQQIGGQPGPASQFPGSSINVAQPASFVKGLQDDHHQQHGPRFQNNVRGGSIHNQQSDVPSHGPNVGYEDSPLARTGNEYYFSGKDGPVMSPQQPKLAAIPMARNQLEMRIGNLPLQNVPPGHPGGFDGTVRPPLHNMYGPPAVASPFPPDPQIRPPPTMIGHSDAILSPVEIYRQKHEVTASGDNVPAPFMTFEATGFPPEILREVRYLLRRRSTCRTLQCYSLLMHRVF